MYALKQDARLTVEEPPSADSVPYRLRSDASTGKAAGAAIYCPDTGRFLFVKRSNTGDAPGTWACLGGGVDPGETIMQAIKREFMEEGEVDTDNFTLHPFYRFDAPGFSYYNFLGVCHEEFDPVLNHEHTEFRWSATPPSPLHPNFEKALRDPRFRQVLDKARAEYLEEDFGIKHDYVSADQELRAEFYDSPQGRYYATIGENTQDPDYTQGMTGGVDNSDFGSGLSPSEIPKIDSSSGPGGRLTDGNNQDWESDTGNMVSSFGFGGGAAGEVHEIGANDLNNGDNHIHVHVHMNDPRTEAPSNGYMATTPTQVESGPTDLEAGPTFEAFKGWAKNKQQEYLKNHPDSSFAKQAMHVGFGKTKSEQADHDDRKEARELNKYLKDPDPEIRKAAEKRRDELNEQYEKRGPADTLRNRVRALKILHRQWKELAVKEKDILKKLRKKWFGAVKSPSIRNALQKKADAIGTKMDAIGDKISILRGN